METLYRIPSRLRELLRSAWIITVEAAAAFIRNDDLRQASSLAFYLALALLPALLLISYALGLAVGSKQTLLKLGELAKDLFPGFSDTLLTEVVALTRRTRASGLLNVAVLLWSVAPLVAAMRSTMHLLFKTQPRHPFWLSKLLDLLLAVLFILGIALTTTMDVVLRFLRQVTQALVIPGWIEYAVPFAITVLVLLLIYYALSPRVRWRHLLVGACVTALLWFLLRPGFGLFLTYNPGYGKMFGSSKSLFIIIIWLYYSMAVFLFGVEIMAALQRKETIFIRRLMLGKAGLPIFGRDRFVVTRKPGELFFSEGEEGVEMFFVLQGSVSILRDGREIAVIPQGKYFGEMSFLLGLTRTATAIAREACECVCIHQRNMDALMREFPQTIHDMLKEMALRLNEANRRQAKG